MYSRSLAIPDRDGTGHVLVTFITGHVIEILLEDSINWSCDRNLSRRFDSSIGHVIIDDNGHLAVDCLETSHVVVSSPQT